MTEYARLHIDECCLVFDPKVKALNKYGEQYYTECVLFRDPESNITFEARYSNDNKDHKAQAEQFQLFRADLLPVIKSLPNDLPGALVKVIQWSDMTEEDITCETDVSVRIIQRLRNDDTHNPPMEVMIQLCIGMRLPSMLVPNIFEKSVNLYLLYTIIHSLFNFIVLFINMKSIYIHNL